MWAIAHDIRIRAPSEIRIQSSPATCDSAVVFVLQSRWARSKSRERRRKSPGRQDSTGTDYAADLSSDHSSPSTQSTPRHRLYTFTGKKSNH